MMPSAYADPDELPEGTLLLGRRYQVLWRIGRGGVATVYRARRDDGTLVALKVLDGDHVGDRSEEQRFENEMRLGAALAEIPAIARPLDAGRLPELGHRPYIALELVEAPTLAEIISTERRLPPLRACEIVRGVADALMQLHMAGVVHRDVKPGNVMVEAQAGSALRVRLLDLGYAWSAGSNTAPATAGLTGTFERPGTKHYMAPEQAAGFPPTARFDVYALAATLYECLLGLSPYAELTPHDAVLRKGRDKKPPMPIGKYLDLEPELVALIEDGMRIDPAERIPSMRDLRDRLDVVIAKLRSDAGVATLRPRLRSVPAPDEASPELPSTGDVVGEGRFEIQGPIGEGGTAIVLRARDHTLGRDVALKLLAPRYLGRPERESRFLREAELLRRVGSHPHVIELLGSGRLADHHDWPWLSMRLVEGDRSLDRIRVHEESLPVRGAAVIARQLADAVRACHRAGVVHRDVTASNVLLDRTRDDAVILIDFSHAANDRAPKVERGHAGRLTQIGEVPGTPGYMPPEQASAAPPDPRMDVFSFGVVLYELLTSAPGYAGHARPAVFIARQSDKQIPPPRIDHEEYPEIPADLARLVEGCTRLEAADRPPISEIVRCLDVAIAAMGMPSPVTGTLPQLAAMPDPPVIRPTPTTEPSMPAHDAPSVERAVAAVGTEHLVEDNDRVGRPGRREAVLIVAGAIAIALAVWMAVGIASTRRESEFGAHTNAPSEAALGASTDAEVEAAPKAVKKDVPDPANAESGKSPLDGGASSPANPSAEAEPPTPAEPPTRAEPRHDPRPKDPEPPATPRTKPRNEPRSEASAVDPDSPECVAQRKAARDAHDKQRWATVLTATRSLGCWRSAMSTRADLRVRAFYNMERFADCAKLEKAASPDVRRVLEGCKQKANTSP